MPFTTDVESIFNSPIERTKFILKYWNKFIVVLNVCLELLLWIGTCQGPLLMLTSVLLSDFYLVWKPALFTFLPGSDYKSAYIQAKREVARFFQFHIAFWHKQEILDFDTKIPSQGGALIVYYHAPIPIDYLGLVTRTYLEKGRLIRSVIDKSMIMMPGAETLVKTFGATAGGREDVIKLLKDGHLVGVAPGGGYEAQLATKDYPVMWKQRKGFAVVAKEAGVPIIPMFTENIRETYCNMQSGMELWAYIFEKTKAPLSPLYGGFPVKLVTHLGDFIDSSEFTVDELRAETIISVQKLIKTHQKLPGNIVRAIRERLEDDVESENESIVECNSDIDEFEDLTLKNLNRFTVQEYLHQSSSEPEALSDSGCVSVSSVEDNDTIYQSFKADSFITLTPSITQLPNGRLVLSHCA